MQFFHILTSKSGPNMVCLVQFDLQTCFASERRATFPHQNFKKCSETVSFFNMFSYKCASRHSSGQFLHIPTSKCGPRPSVFFNSLTCKCASRYSSVQFFLSMISKSAPNMVCFVHFDLQMCFAPQRHAIFPHPDFKKCSETVSFFNMFSYKCASRHSSGQFLHIPTSKCGPRP